MCRGMEFQSMTVLGINEYFRQFLFVAIWMNWLCLDERRTGRRIVCVGMARRPDRAWCKMETLFTFLLSSNDSHSSSFFISVTLLPRLYLPVTKRAPLFCTDSNFCVSSFVDGSHTDPQYSMVGRTNVLYARFLTFLEHEYKFLFIVIICCYCCCCCYC